MTERFFTIELTPDECDAIKAMCELSGIVLRDASFGGALSARERESIRVRVNGVRYKMGAALAMLPECRDKADIPGLIALDPRFHKPNG